MFSRLGQPTCTNSSRVASGYLSLLSTGTSLSQKQIPSSFSTLLIIFFSVIKSLKACEAAEFSYLSVKKLDHRYFLKRISAWPRASRFSGMYVYNAAITASIAFVGKRFLS